MTDNEIIKALKYCIDGQSCYECTYRLCMSAQCMDNLMRDALTLINRQQSEIEILKEKNNCSTHLLIQSVNFINRQKAEIETARTEAIKEFAEDVKEKRNILFNVIYSDLHFSNTIDNLVKEMTEGENVQS